MRIIAPLAAALLASTAAQADTLIANVNGIQADARGKIERFTGILIGKDGRVERLLHGEMLKLGGDTNVVDMGGKTLLPGLIDAHGHIMALGETALTLDLTGSGSLAEMQQRIRDYAAAHPDYPWILGRGWNQELWSEKRFPTAADMDAAVADRPVWLSRVDGHASIANSAAMKLAGVGPQTAAPSGGEIHDGLFVDNAQGLVDKVVPPPTPAMRDRTLAEAQAAMLKVGLVGAADMGTAAEDWAAMRRAGDAGALNVRLFIYASAPENWRAINGGKPTDWMYGDRLKLMGTKLYADGALGSRGAWLKAPYADRPDTRGLQFHSDAELLAQARETAAGGGQVAIHAIGDAANAQVISTYEILSRDYGAGRRWRIEHFQVVDPRDIPRLKPAGIIASMQPTHQTSDRLMAEKRLGPDRLEGSYAWATVLKLGIPIAFGSDFPVESPNPFPGLSAAISRQDLNGQPPGGWRPQERLSFGQALAAFTRGGAYAGFAEGKLGCLDRGCQADFVIVDRDPTRVDAQSLGRTQVLQTWIGGAQAWGGEPSAARGERGK